MIELVKQTYDDFIVCINSQDPELYVPATIFLVSLVGISMWIVSLIF